MSDERELMSDVELTKIQRLCEAATPGPWSENYGNVWSDPDDAESVRVLNAKWMTHQDSERPNAPAVCPDAAFAAAARTAVPALIARLRNAEQQRDAMSNEAQRMQAGARGMIESGEGSMYEDGVLIAAQNILAEAQAVDA